MKRVSLLGGVLGRGRPEPISTSQLSKPRRIWLRNLSELRGGAEERRLSKDPSEHVGIREHHQLRSLLSGDRGSS